MEGFFNTYGFLFVSMLLAATLALSLYLPLLAGQLSLASPGFYAVGGYIAAVISTKVYPSSDGSYSLALVFLEMGLALALAIFIVWFTWPKRRPPSTDDGGPDRDPPRNEG